MDFFHNYLSLVEIWKIQNVTYNQPFTSLESHLKDNISTGFDCLEIIEKSSNFFDFWPK